jgi:hypothetical protein
MICLQDPGLFFLARRPVNKMKREKGKGKGKRKRYLYGNSLELRCDQVS